VKLPGEFTRMKKYSSGIVIKICPENKMVSPVTLRLTKMKVIAAFIVFILITLLTTLVVIKNTEYYNKYITSTTIPIKEQLSELNRIKNSLVDLTLYVSTQEEKMKELEYQIGKLNINKENYGKYLTLEKNNIDVALREINSRAIKEFIILTIVASYVMGIFSSLTVVFVLKYMAKNK
jgi:hypothetical protein